MLCWGFKSVSEAAFCLYVSLSLHVILGKLFINFIFFFFVQFLSLLNVLLFLMFVCLQIKVEKCFVDIFSFINQFVVFQLLKALYTTSHTLISEATMMKERNHSPPLGAIWVRVPKDTSTCRSNSRSSD